MKRRRFIYNPKTSAALPSRVRRNLNARRGLALESPEKLGLEGKKCRVIVELDGAVHEGPLETERDETRTTYLKELGIRMMRFENRTVFESLGLVLNSIRIELQESLDHTTPAFGHPSSC